MDTQEDYIWDTFVEEEALRFADGLLFYWDYWFESLSADEQEAVLRRAFTRETEQRRERALKEYVEAHKSEYHRYLTKVRNGDF